MCARLSARYDSADEANRTPRKSAPKAIGPYSQAVKHAGLVYLSGQIPLDPATGQLVEGDVEAQTERVLENLSAVLEAAGLRWTGAEDDTCFSGTWANSRG